MLAQKQMMQEDITSIVIFCIILILAILLIWIVYGFARSRFTKTEKRPASSFWSLDDIRKLRDQGQLSEEEYKNLRDIVAERSTRETKTPTAPKPNRPATPAEDNEEGEIVWQAENPHNPPKSDDDNQSNV